MTTEDRRPAPFYVDPRSEEWRTPNLITGLMKTPATESLHPLERQLTIVLAWLLHHSPGFAREFTQLFFADDEDAMTAHATATAIGARAWGTLRPTGPTGYLYPDLSVAGAARAFELLVEVKVGASIHHWDTDAGPLYQPDAYIRSWRSYDGEDEAAVRRVGTLTKAGPGIELTPDPMRARDVTWRQLRERLAVLLESGAIEPVAAAVAVDFAAAIDEFVLPTPTPQTDDPELAWGYLLLHELAPRLAAALPDGAVKASPAIYKDYVTAYIHFKSDGASERLWLAVTPEGARYNVKGHGSMLWLAEPTDTSYSDDLAARFRSAGFERHPETPYPSLRIGVEVNELQAAGADDQADYALAWALRELRPTGILVTDQGEQT